MIFRTNPRNRSPDSSLLLCHVTSMMQDCPLRFVTQNRPTHHKDPLVARYFQLTYTLIQSDTI